MPMKKDIISIHLFERLIFGVRKTYDEINTGWFDDRIKCLMTINKRSLIKALGNKLSLIVFNKTIKVSFDIKHLFITNQIL